MVIWRRSFENGIRYLLVGILPIQTVPPGLGVVLHASESVHLRPLAVVLAVVELIDKESQFLVH